MIYDEQRIAGAQLQQIERKVSQLRSNFNKLMMQKKGYLTSYEELDALFDFKADNNNKIHAEVKYRIKQIKERQFSHNLEDQLSKLAVRDKKEELANRSKQGTHLSKPKTIRDNLKKNPMI
jgi:ribosomal protein S8